MWRSGKATCGTKAGASHRADPVILEELTSRERHSTGSPRARPNCRKRRRYQTGDTMKVDQRGSAVLGEEECRHLLESAAARRDHRANRHQRSPITLRRTGEFHHRRWRDHDPPRPRLGCLSSERSGRDVRSRPGDGIAAFRLERRGPGCVPRGHVRRDRPARETISPPR